MASFSERLKNLRNDKGLLQRELAEQLNLSRVAVTQYENGNRSPDQETLKKLANFFNVTIDFLLGESDIQNPYQNDTIHKAVEEDPELLEFYEEMKDRDNLKLLFKQTKDMDDKDIRQILRIIKAIEDEEDGE